MKTYVMMLTFIFALIALPAFSSEAKNFDNDDAIIQSDSWNMKIVRASKESGETLEVRARDTGKLLATYKPPFRTQHFDTAEEIEIDKYPSHLLVMLWDSGPHGQILVVINPVAEAKAVEVKTNETKAVKTEIKPLYELESSGPITFYAEDDHIVINYYALNNPYGDSLDEIWKPGTPQNVTKPAASSAKPASH